jgi:hypothetical protein
MSRRAVNITLDNLDDLPRRCRNCVFWELDPVSYDRAVEDGDTAFEKESWVSATLLEWGSCGKIAYVDSVPAGYVMYAPPMYVPRSVAFPTSPVSGDAVLLMTGYVLPEFAGGGIGRMLVQGVAKDLQRRGIKAIEAFGDLQHAGPACVMPAEYAEDGDRLERERRGGSGEAARLDHGPRAAPGLDPPRSQVVGVGT